MPQLEHVLTLLEQLELLPSFALHQLKNTSPTTAKRIATTLPQEDSKSWSDISKIIRWKTIKILRCRLGLRP